MRLKGAALCLSALLCLAAPAGARARARTLLGVPLGGEVSGWLEGVEGKLGRPVYAEFRVAPDRGFGLARIYPQMIINVRGGRRPARR